MSLDTCTVCVERFNTIRKPIICEFCEYICCSKCITRYLEQQKNTLTCLNCAKEWSLEFIYNKTTTTFVNKHFRNFKKKALLEEAKEHIPLVQREIEIQNKINQLYLEINRLRRELENIMIDDNNKRKCPNPECRGVLTNNACGLCNTSICKDCEEIIQNTHVCNPDILASVKEIKKSAFSRPCPGCGIYISKISGCDQMYCVECHTAWSWNTRRIVRGKIHNPHYYEYVRKARGSVPRDIDDRKCNAESEIRNFIHQNDNKGFCKKIAKYYHSIRDYMVNANNIMGVIHEDNDLNLLTKYLSNKIDDKKLCTSLYAKYRKHQAQRRYVEILNTFTITAMEILFEITTVKIDRDIYKLLDQINEDLTALINICNDDIRVLQKTFNLHKYIRCIHEFTTDTKLYI